VAIFGSAASKPLDAIVFGRTGIAEYPAACSHGEKGESLNQIEANEIRIQSRGGGVPETDSSQPQPSQWPALIEKEPCRTSRPDPDILETAPTRRKEKQSSAGDAALAAIKKTINGE
jgi:hypothetical protein